MQKMWSAMGHGSPHRRQISDAMERNVREMNLPVYEKEYRIGREDKMEHENVTSIHTSKVLTF